MLVYSDRTHIQSSILVFQVNICNEDIVLKRDVLTSDFMLSICCHRGAQLSRASKATFWKWRLVALLTKQLPSLYYTTTAESQPGYQERTIQSSHIKKVRTIQSSHVKKVRTMHQTQDAKWRSSDRGRTTLHRMCQGYICVINKVFDSIHVLAVHATYPSPLLFIFIQIVLKITLFFQNVQWCLYDFWSYFALAKQFQPVVRYCSLKNFYCVRNWS